MKNEIRLVNGRPTLYIGGKAEAPVLFFGNTDFGKNVTAQVRLAAAAGIHLHSVIYNLHFTDSAPETCPGAGLSDPYADLDRCLDAVLGGDPDAQIFLRVKTGAYFRTVPAEWKDELITFTDGSNFPQGSDMCLTSTSSEKWADAVDGKLRAIVGYIRASHKYAEHVACIHLENCEWFEYGFRESGSDVSAPADSRFAEWQKRKYGESFHAAPVPRDLPNNISFELYKNTLLLCDDERRFVDYFDFIGDLVSSRIERFARTVKEASDGEMLVIAFYGYLFELCDCQSGHYRLDKLLNSQYLDGFAGPVSYGDRGRDAPRGASGATSAFMTAADSIARHGKLWFQESDQRTAVNGSPKDGWLPALETADAIADVHRREMADVMLHGCGIWFMDLMDTGWLMDEWIWRNIGELAEQYRTLIKSQTPSSAFDAVFVIDEAAESVVGQPSFNGISGSLFYTMRYEAYRSGISFALAEMNDVADGRFSDGKLFIFLNPYRISRHTAEKLKTALAGKKSVWLYGFGSDAADDVSALTGMDIVRTSPGNTAFKASDGRFSDPPCGSAVTARWTVSSGGVRCGVYEDGKTAAAVNGRACFWGGTSLGRQNIRALARWAGVHVWCDSGDVLVTDGRALMYCATEAGEKTLTYPDGRTVCFSAKAGQTFIFRS